VGEGVGVGIGVASGIGEGSGVGVGVGVAIGSGVAVGAGDGVMAGAGVVVGIGISVTLAPLPLTISANCVQPAIVMAINTTSITSATFLFHTILPSRVNMVPAEA
jgi:hypothetical protein